MYLVEIYSIVLVLYELVTERKSRNKTPQIYKRLRIPTNLRFIVIIKLLLTSTASAATTTAAIWTVAGHMTFPLAIITGHLSSFVLFWTIARHVTILITIVTSHLSRSAAVRTVTGHMSFPITIITSHSLFLLWAFSGHVSSFVTIEASSSTASWGFGTIPANVSLFLKNEKQKSKIVFNKFRTFLKIFEIFVGHVSLAQHTLKLFQSYKKNQIYLSIICILKLLVNF